jgi:hypothetical protein
VTFHAGTPDTQAALLGDTFFLTEGQACATETDIDPTTLPSRDWVPFVASKLQEAIQGTSNTSALGPSGIGYKQIKCIANVDAKHLLMLYNASVELGHMATPWKAEKLVAVPKLCKTDMSSPKSYHPISLIKTLSKVLKRMMAMDCATHGLLPNSQFGGLRHMGTNDVGLALVHEVEMAWNHGKTCVAIAADIQQFFLSVQHKHLLHMATLKGWLPPVIFWLQSFLSNRSYFFQIGVHTTPTHNFNGCGMPRVQWRDAWLSQWVGHGGEVCSQVRGEISHVMLVSDNQSAIQQITKTGTHPMQLASLLFCNSTDEFFNSGGAQVTIGWICRHAGLAGNKTADALAKEAAQMLLQDSHFAGSLVTYKCAQAKRMIDMHWQMEWRHCKKVSTSVGFAVGRRLPSYKFKDNRCHNTKWPLGQVFKSTCWWGARVMQVMLGHRWFGVYCLHFNLGDLLCPCSNPLGDADKLANDDPAPVLQTQWHLLYKCPLFKDAWMPHLYNHALQLLPSKEILFGSSDGIKHLLAFLSVTNVFGPICSSYQPQISTTAPPSGAKVLVA